MLHDHQLLIHANISIVSNVTMLIECEFSNDKSHLSQQNKTKVSIPLSSFSVSSFEM